MSWNHRVIEFRDPDGSVWRAIHEVHYDDAGLPVAYTEGHAVVIADAENCPEEMIRILDRMRAAVEKPVLIEKDFVGKIDDVVSTPTQG
jgi:hypothetical protein